MVKRDGTSCAPNEGGYLVIRRGEGNTVEVNLYSHGDDRLLVRESFNTPAAAARAIIEQRMVSRLDHALWAGQEIARLAGS